MSTGAEEYRDLPILGELREELRARFAAAAPAAERQTLRRRWPHASTRLGVVLVALAVAGGTSLAAGLLSGERSRPLTAALPSWQPSIQEGYGPPGSTYSISISPSMQTGVIGWCTSLVTYRGSQSFDLGTGGCNGAPPAVGAPMFGAQDGGVGEVGLSYVFTAPQVAAVRVARGPTILTRPDARLPFGFRAAVFSLPLRLLRGPGVELSALDATGRVIPGDPYAEPVTEATRSWRAPAAPATGACSISPRRGAPVVLLSGTVLRQAIGDPGLIGRAFLPCLDTTFTLHGTRFTAAILLDAGRPGRMPAELPGMQPLAGRPGILTRRRAMTNIVDDEANTLDIAARRDGTSWLVVAGGRDSAQRAAALQALTVGPVDAGRAAPPPTRPSGARCWIAYRPAGGLRALSQTARTGPPPVLTALARRGGWRVHGRFREITVGHTTYVFSRAERAFLANPPCASATFLMGDWTLEATLQLAVGRGLPSQLAGTTLLGARAGRVVRRGSQGGGTTWQQVGGAWLAVTGATVGRQEALLRALTVTAPAR